MRRCPFIVWMATIAEVVTRQLEAMLCTSAANARKTWLSLAASCVRLNDQHDEKRQALPSANATPSS